MHQVPQNLDEPIRILGIVSNVAQVVQHLFPAELEQAKSRNVVIVVDWHFVSTKSLTGAIRNTYRSHHTFASFQ